MPTSRVHRPAPRVALLLVALSGTLLGGAQAGGGGRPPLSGPRQTSAGQATPVQTGRTLSVELPPRTSRLSVSARPGDTLRLTFFEDTLNDPRRWGLTLPAGAGGRLQVLPATRTERSDHGYGMMQLDGRFTLRVPAAALPGTVQVRLDYAAPGALDAEGQSSFPAQTWDLTVTVLR